MWSGSLGDFTGRGDVDNCEVLVNLVGNAFSLFHYGPFFLATVATVGKFTSLTDDVGTDDEAQVQDMESGDSTDPEDCTDTSSASSQ